MKFIRIVTGLNACTSAYFCAFCEANGDDQKQSLTASDVVNKFKPLGEKKTMG